MRLASALATCIALVASPALTDPAPATLLAHVDTATTPTPFLVTDSVEFVEMGGVAYFNATGPETGPELWRSDGTQAGTALVKDIAAGDQDKLWLPGPGPITNVNGTLFFRLDDGARGEELWKSDGSFAGTTLVKDIQPGPGGSWPGQLTAMNGTLFFTADDGVHGQELWKSDGTEAGTVLVKDLYPGAYGAFQDWRASEIVDVNGTLFFFAYGGLWKSDGTTSGTVLVKDVPGSYGFFELTNMNGRLFFWTVGSNSGVTVGELWVSDGTDAGTVNLRQIGYVDDEDPSSYPFFLTSFRGSLFFAAIPDLGFDRELWKSDGTVAGTVLVKDIEPGTNGSFPATLTVVNGTLFFSAQTSANGSELWKSDGTAAGTVLVKDIVPGPSSSLVGYVFDPGFASLGGALYFAADDGVNSVALWKSDGTEAGTVLVKDPVPPGSQFDGSQNALKRLTNVGGTLFFAVADRYTTDTKGLVAAYQLWRSDGTAAGTFELEGGPARGGRDFAIANSALFLPARDGAGGVELWKTDGTPSCGRPTGRRRERRA